MLTGRAAPWDDYGMPSRTPADQALIVKTFRAVGSGRETARRLGLHENTVYAALRRHQGKCARCRRPLRPVTPGLKHCRPCLKALRERMRQRHKERRWQGLCVRCNRRVRPPSHLYCSAHRRRQREIQTRYRLKVDGTPNPQQRERAIREHHGVAAVRVWRRYAGRCVICGAPHRAAIHHVDGNPKHGHGRNLTVLCRRCHQLVHLVLAHDRWALALRWLRRTYPRLARA